MSKPELVQQTPTELNVFSRSMGHDGPRLLLKISADGTSHYETPDDLARGCCIFWHVTRGNLDSNISYEKVAAIPYDVTVFFGGDHPMIGFRLMTDRTIQYLGGYSPDEKTQHAIMTLASLR